MSAAPRSPRYDVVPSEDVLADVAALAVYGPDIVCRRGSDLNDLAYMAGWWARTWAAGA